MQYLSSDAGIRTLHKMKESIFRQVHAQIVEQRSKDEYSYV